MRTILSRRVAGIVAAGLVATALPVAFAPTAMASDNDAVYATACPDGYKGVIVGTNGGIEIFACTNLLP